MMMMMPQAQPSFSSTRSSPLLPPKPSSSVILSSPSFLNIRPRLCHHHLPATKHYLRKNNCIRATSSSKPAVSTTTTALEAIIIVKAVVTVQVQKIAAKPLNKTSTANPLDETFLLELVSADLDPKTGLEKETIKGYAHKVSQEEKIVTYESELRVPEGFGDIGAVQVENEQHEEAYIKSIELTGFPNGTSVNVPCNSWTHSKYDNNQKRIFFTNKSYIPSGTPSGIKRLREEELQFLRGNGDGERKSSERIYDYDVYNDLGDPDSADELARPVLGGKDHPYPRRCRTGRPRTKKDPLSEERSSDVYVPRDEAFAEVKQLAFTKKALMSGAHAFLPQIGNPELGFPNFTAIDSLFKSTASWLFQSIIPSQFKDYGDRLNDVLFFETPELHDRDKFSWFRDEEFSRQTLAGLNPYSIQLVTEWPLKSKLDPEIYGPPESLITTALVERDIRGCMSVDEALKRKKLFILDYHDLLMPYVKKVRDIERTTLYGSRTLFFLTENGTLRPLAIELTRPPIGDKPQWKEVFTPTWDATGCWLWRIAKAHVCAHDAGYHQLVIHWLRTHCCTEPYIIAANRQLSAMHPIYRLLHPHFRYTMEINARARQNLINADGIIETCFSPAKYSIELSSTAYDQLWRFDMEALPADLIRRGMAVEDPTTEHGVKLTIEDYPFANDGLIMWDAIKEWVGDYVDHYYPNPTLVESDNELQAWWTEVRTKGHADKKDEPWWPVLKTPQDLVHILTTIIWVTAGHHAAVNFGQYMYAGYFPNRPTIARTNMPTEDANEEDFKMFLKKPEAALLRCFPSPDQATKVMAVLDVLSNHSPDEEYIGENAESSWAENPVIKAAFERFNGNLKKLEGIIDERNTNMNLKNRVGAGVVPYELLKPFSESGVTGKGVPNSISI